MSGVDLVLMVSDDTGVRYERCRLEPSAWLSVGRAWSSDVLVRDPLVDPVHLQLTLGEDEQLSISDQGTLNGSRLNGLSFSG